MIKKVFTGFVFVSLCSMSAFATNDTNTTTTYNQPQGGSLTNSLSADGNTANNNGSVWSGSSATANHLNSDISNISRVEASNAQLGLSSNDIKNTNQSYSGGNDLTSNANAISGGNTLTNGQGQGQGQSSANTLGQGQGQSQGSTTSGNTTNSATSTTFQDNSSSTVKIPQQAPPVFAPNIGVAGNNGVSGGFSTPFGGLSAGITRMDKSVKELNYSAAEKANQEANQTYFYTVRESCEMVTAEQCEALKVQYLKRMGVHTKKGVK